MTIPLLDKQIMKYFIYCRKSSEDKNRQVQSIDDQIRDIKHLCANKGIKESQIVETITESFSAKAPGRPRFNAMIQ
jgi:DNA invertase Pin-like site-specific DNA recombinase